MVSNKLRHMRKMQEPPKKQVSAVVYSVDNIGRTALVRIGGGASAIRLPILTQTSADSLANKVASGDKPKVLLRDGYVIEADSLGQSVGATNVSIIVSGIDLGALNSDFYSHIGDPDAHHAAFVGLLDSANAVINPSGQRIKINGSNGILATAGSTGVLELAADGTLARSAIFIQANNGLVGGGNLSVNVPLAVGAGDGISVSADAVSVDSTVARASTLANAGAGLTGGGTIGSNFTFNVGQGNGIVVNADDVAINFAMNPSWLGNHTFNASIETSTIRPRVNDLYDLGSLTQLWRKIFASEFDTVLFAENTIQITGGYQLICKDQGTLEGGCLAADTTINFGKAMTPNDFVVMRVTGKVEYIQVGSLVSGTVYNVTRNLDGSGANDWVSGTPFAVFGYNGNGRIELNAYDSPRTSIIKQGTTWNDTKEVLRFGDLNGNWGYGVEKYGIAIGSYEPNKFNIVADEDGTIRIRNHTTEALVFSPSSSYLASPLTFGLNGGFFIGDGTFGSPIRGLKMGYLSGYGVLQGYNSSTVQASFNEFGEITWAGGNGKLSAAGAVLVADASGSLARGFQFINASGDPVGSLVGRSQPFPTLLNTIDLASKVPVGGGSARTRIAASDPAFLNDAEINVEFSGTSTINMFAQTISSQSKNGMTIENVTSGAMNLYNTNGNINISGKTMSISPIINSGTSFPSMAVDGIAARSDLGYHGWWYNRSGSWSQISIPVVTAFPASPQTNHLVYHATYRSFWKYDGTAWRQISRGAFNGSFPASPQDKMIVWRVDRNIEYFYNSATAEWYSTQTFEAAFGAVRIFDQYTTANTSTSDVVAFILLLNNKTYGVRIVDTHFTSIVGATNNGSNYWTYTVNYQSNSGGTMTTLLTGNTSAIAINTSTNHAITDQNIGQTATAGRIAVLVRYLGTPTGLSFRGVVNYRLVG